MTDGELGPRAGRLPLIGGALALDFCNTTSGLGMAHCLEHLNGFEHLALWSAHAGAVTPAEAHRLRHLALNDPAAARAALEQALSLRRTLHDLFEALAHRLSPPGELLAALNAALVPNLMAQRLVATPSGFAWHYPAPDDALDGPLLPIARSAADILLNEPRDRLKQCPGHDCGWLFLDRSKNNIRVWCEMEVCGARAKARARAERRHNH
ncbi:hypothetical protein GCM10011611_54270 [Aliidongia dinghuensis]|uniref:Zinc finger CGNR domain-containing protein n=1 Tax=Aliidongia dinghuensis TaxID=1867774 RepID=A0A8J2YZL2_9PROT|nr:CGNR zinc finger domain-containing protein [Aliidongia dinghuensis]GGF40971.1 hypothetical protein GCM10011611_54270 [Aliidongia dinghuensis]